MATHDCPDWPVGVIAVHDSGNDFAGDHVTGVYAVPHVTTGDHGAHVGVERQIERLTSHLPRWAIAQRSILKRKIVGVG
jgi:hypothetical protein